MAREGDVPDNETEGYANPISRRNSKRAAKRQPHGDDKDGDEEGDDGVERFLLVKLQRRKVRTEAVSKGIDATSSAAVAELLLQGEIWLGGKGEVKEEGSEQEEKGSPPFHPCWCCLVFSDISGDGDPDLGTPCSSGKKVGAWGKEVGGQEGVRASEGDGRACDGPRTASSVWFVELACICCYRWRAFLFWDRWGPNLFFSGGRSGPLGSGRPLPRCVLEEYGKVFFQPRLKGYGETKLVSLPVGFAGRC
ncbi:uncharacterized protein [Triticum aestivum]|uniref:uncharacterized protein n=1 Tax=Triticum aestivum TaxID=4565 RepID=UPI001D022F6D|nr:uncharacterized protein LOC123133555 [Triticum aestivum]XP_044408960.1 uncharacterized protein LOC123133555 [Triticum aestivum]